MTHYLTEVVECLVQVSKHAGRWLIGDLDGHLEDAARDDMRVASASRLGTDKHSVVRMTLQTILLKLFLQSIKPLGHQMDIL